MRRKTGWILGVLLLLQSVANAQQDPAAVYDKFMQLTKMFTGSKPYACSAIVSVKYKLVQQKNTSDTSWLIYKNGQTHYKSRTVERLEGPQGELMINHELKTATLAISDSIREVLQKELKMETDKALEARLDADYERKDEIAFKTYVLQHTNITQQSKDGVNEISIIPKSNNDPAYISMKIRFTSEGRVIYYEYTNTEHYATDWNGKPRIRWVTTIYDRFKYENVPDIPVKLTDYIDWNDWSVKLKKYTNYKFSLL